MKRFTIPNGAWMKYRKNGRTLFGQKGKTIIWGTKPPPAGTTVHVVCWHNGQMPLMASKTEVIK